MRGDINFKGSDSRDPSVYFLFCDFEFLSSDAADFQNYFANAEI